MAKMCYTFVPNCWEGMGGWGVGMNKMHQRGMIVKVFPKICSLTTLQLAQKSKYNHSVHPPFLLLGWGGKVEPPTKFSKREGLTGSKFLEGGCSQRGWLLFSGDGCCSFYIKIYFKNSYFDTITCK